MKLRAKFAACFFVARRYLFGLQFGNSNRGGRYLLGAAGGIALSLVPIMATLIVADGMIRGITDRFLELGTGHIQIRGSEFSEETGLSIELAMPVVENQPEVRGVWNEMQGTCIVLGSKGKTGATVRATSPSFWQDEGSKRYLTTISGDAALDESGAVLLGSALAKKTGAETGSTLRIMTVRTLEDGRRIPRTMRFKVKGIVSSGYHEIDSMWCLISFEDGEKLFEKNNAANYLILKVNDPYDGIDELAASITNRLQGFFFAYTWKQVQPLQYSSYEQTRQMLLFIMALIVLIAAVNVSSAISMLVIERRRDIAVLKAFGTGQAGITLIFMTGSLLTALTGGITGAAAGLLFGSHINEVIRALEMFINFWTGLFNKGPVRILDPGFYLETIPIVIQWTTVAGIVIFMIFCALAASAFPAFRAGRSKPVELLRKAHL